MAHAENWLSLLVVARRSLLGLACVVLPCAVSAQTAPPAITESPEQTLPSDKVEQRKDNKDNDEQKDRSPWRLRWDDHPSIALGKGTRIDVRFRFQGDIDRSDAALSDEEPGEEDAFIDVARRRFGLEGEILDVVDYQLEREIGVGRDPWRDVFVNYKQFGIAEVQAGKFKLPFGMDENTSATNLDFAMRARISDALAPGRDRGVMLHGRLFDRGTLQYELGWFNQDGRNARRNDDRVHGDRTVAGRVILQPLRGSRSLLRDLAFGMAFTSSTLPEGFPDLRGRTAFDESFYRPDVWVEGGRRRVGLQARWRPGPFSIKSEYIRLTDERRGQSAENTDLPSLLAHGWYLSSTWALTGEIKASGLERPRRSVFRGGYGAIELAGRVEQLRFGSVSSDGVAATSPRADVILGNALRGETFGVNWYANRWVKLQFDLVHETIADPTQGPVPSQPSQWGQVWRLQFSM